MRRLRLAAVRSNVGPLAAAYRALYLAGARTVVAVLARRFPEHLDAVYLRGSLAMDLLVPGLSDVDLLVVLRDSVSAEAHEQVQVCYRRLAARCPALDPHPWILRRFEVEKLFRENPALRFRVLEARQAARLVRGVDRLAELPEPAPSEVAIAQLLDLKSRLTYFNAFCLAPGPTDELEARRKEYLLFKLAVDLARVALFLATGRSIFRRLEIVELLAAAAPATREVDDLAGGPLLREFVAHTRRFRLRRPFTRDRGVDLDGLEQRLLARTLELLVAFHAHPDVRDGASLAAEHEHFYDAERFLPSGHRFEIVSGTSPGDYPALKRRVLAGHASGIDTVLCHGGLLVNLSNADPRLGNCTVVALTRVGV